MNLPFYYTIKLGDMIWNEAFYYFKKDFCTCPFILTIIINLNEMVSNELAVLIFLNVIYELILLKYTKNLNELVWNELFYYF